MLLVSLPHDKIVDLNTKYLVYDTDDGIIEKAWATDILSMYYKNRDMFPNIQQTQYGGMLRKHFVKNRQRRAMRRQESTPFLIGSPRHDAR